MPRVETMGVPNRIPLAIAGGFSSYGTAFLFTMMPAASSAASASLPVMPLFVRFTNMRCVSVPPDTMLYPPIQQALGQDTRIGDDLLLVALKCWREGFLEGHRLGGNHVHQRSALHAWKHELVDGLGVLRLAHHHTTAGAAQRLVGGRGYEIGMR